MVVVVVVMVFVIFLGEKATDVFPVFFVGEGCDSNEVDRPSGVPYSDSLPPRSSSPAASSSSPIASLSLSLSLSRVFFRDTKTCVKTNKEKQETKTVGVLFVLLLFCCLAKARQERDEKRMRYE
tara:strand:+ start:4990 stop:5361 length:372 start_codon:yes stop_codon:yes gene_type:complete